MGKGQVVSNLGAFDFNRVNGAAGMRLPRPTSEHIIIDCESNHYDDSARSHPRLRLRGLTTIETVITFIPHKRTAQCP